MKYLITKAGSGRGVIAKSTDDLCEKVGRDRSEVIRQLSAGNGKAIINGYLVEIL